MIAIKAFKLLIAFIRDTIYSLVYFKTFKIYFCNHLTIGIKYLNEQGTIFPHPVGIVLGKKVKLGKNCIIYQNVTIGTKETKEFLTAAYPVLENNVTIFANSVIFGDITIGSNSIIGAGSVVFENVPANCVVAGNPAKIIRRKTN
ncbi:serine O-acetyltransferase [Dyadobacter psychrophilus]|uniref:Serine O-acetyltransferase n=1 Tax=Dyadobacter psychrophilus TaxID=651661 RepID=A0A1T5HCL3_9BACT|nr:serine acetyltransferase [Dyadobacter psychrophilus]SKC18437.1 serine O-acetyltransferase [Dyadobacter psychrophilus]